MNRADLIDALNRYQPYNEQEQRDCRIIKNLLETCADIYERSNLLAHMTASAWILNQDHTKVLMAYHNIYQSYAWLGGHADGDEDLPSVAIREAQEESGITHVRLLNDEIFSLETIVVEGHEKKGKYVPSHLHLNITYLLEADEQEQLHVKADENSSVKWFSLNDAVEAANEPWMKERIYKKLNAKLRKRLYADSFI